ncbi:MAG: acetolactate synthase small subunit [Bacillota bacterium]
MIHVLVAKVASKTGVLSRVAGHFTRRGYNIKNIAACETHDPDFVHLTISIEADERDVELVINQLSRLADVIEAHDASKFPSSVERQFMIVKVGCTPNQRQEILKIADTFSCRVVSIGEKNVIFEIADVPSNLSAAARAFEHYGILELIKTGSIIMES